MFARLARAGMQSGCVMIAGDIVCQTMFNRRPPLGTAPTPSSDATPSTFPDVDIARALRMVLHTMHLFFYTFVEAQRWRIISASCSWWLMRYIIQISFSGSCWFDTSRTLLSNHVWLHRRPVWPSTVTRQRAQENSSRSIHCFPDLLAAFICLFGAAWRASLAGCHWICQGQGADCVCGRLRFLAVGQCIWISLCWSSGTSDINVLTFFSAVPVFWM